LSFRRSDENRKGCKCELAAPTFDSERNYKCIRSIKITTAFGFLAWKPSAKCPVGI
jgi:hypothetical protein